MVFVARDQATWEKVKEAFGAPKMLPIGMKKEGDLGLLDGTDFQKEMIVAVLWGEMNFSRGDEKCWIEEVAILKDEVVVDCRAMLWGIRGCVIRGVALSCESGASERAPGEVQADDRVDGSSRSHGEGQDRGNHEGRGMEAGVAAQEIAGLFYTESRRGSDPMWARGVFAG